MYKMNSAYLYTAALEKSAIHKLHSGLFYVYMPPSLMENDFIKFFFLLNDHLK